MKAWPQPLQKVLQGGLNLRLLQTEVSTDIGSPTRVQETNTNLGLN